MKDKRQKTKAKRLIFLFSFCFLLLALLGCDAFVRKFTRKPKHENLPVEEMVVAPEEYKGQEMSKEELYRQYFLFWKTWHDELLLSLREKRSQKKQIDCIEQAINNLIDLKPLLQQQAREKLGFYINQEMELKDFIGRDFYGVNSINNIYTAERIKSNILRDFSYNKVKEYLL